MCFGWFEALLNHFNGGTKKRREESITEPEPEPVRCLHFGYFDSDFETSRWNNEEGFISEFDRISERIDGERVEFFMVRFRTMGCESSSIQFYKKFNSSLNGMFITFNSEKMNLIEIKDRIKWIRDNTYQNIPLMIVQRRGRTMSSKEVEKVKEFARNEGVLYSVDETVDGRDAVLKMYEECLRKGEELGILIDLNNSTAKGTWIPYYVRRKPMCPPFEIIR